jgi:predicted RNase H-like HicB family nuclease
MEIQFTTQVFKEGKAYVAHTSELDISSCGDTEQKALDNLNEAVTLFLEEADKLGTLDQILDEAGYFKHGDTLEGPEFIGTQRISLPLPLLHVKEA